VAHRLHRRALRKDARILLLDFLADMESESLLPQ
jgi:hypothetical protein